MKDLQSLFFNVVLFSCLSIAHILVAVKALSYLAKTERYFLERKCILVNN